MEKWLELTFQRIVDKFSRSAKDAANQGILPYKTENGKIMPAPFDGNSWWTGGFWPGLMWQLYHSTGNGAFMEEALRTEALLTRELENFSALHHDVGFMYLLSCGAHHKLTGNKIAYRDTLHAATLLAGRFNPAGFIRAWNPDDRIGWAIVDCMMNLSLLYWATKQTGDPRFSAIARIHADTCIKEFVRENGSCNHIVIFDPESGKALAKPGGQGYCEGSSWSRGQAWGLYGFVLAYLGLKEQRYLDTACRIADYFISQIRSDGLTDCDFCQPKEEERIDNIAAACASCGLLELAKLNIPNAQKYHDAAVRMLRAMDELCADWSDNAPGILQKCTASYHDDGAGRHINIFYGDYFFVEAICKLRGTDARLWMTEE